MRSTGIVRKIDELGRVVIPKETRRVLNIKEGDPLEVYTEGGAIILKKYIPGCNCCGELTELTEIMGIKLCKKCISDFHEARNKIDELR